MTELAAGAVSSLLVVVRDEALLLGGVQDDVQFIKEEMESMRSFLAHLARSTPPGREHDEQVRTWMNQVRLLAQDCHNCIDLYLYSGNPHIHRAKSRLRRYLWWVYWFLRKMLAQHRAAVQLRQLKDRARDVGERRLRYGVEVPTKSWSAAGQSSPPAAVAGGYAAGDDEDEDGDDDRSTLATTDHSSQRALFSRTLGDYVKAKIRERIEVADGAIGSQTMSFVIMAPEKEKYRDVITLVRETSVSRPGFQGWFYNLAVLIDIPALHYEFSPLRPKEVLFYILRQIKLLKQGTDQGGVEEDSDFWQRHSQKNRIYQEKEMALQNIEESIKRMEIYAKLEKIKSDLQNQQPKKSQEEDMDQKDPDVHELLKQLLRSSLPASQQDQLMKDKDMPNKLSASDNAINLVAKKLKNHMEAIEQGEERGVAGGVQNGAVEEDREGGKGKVEVSGGGGEIMGGGGGGGEGEGKIKGHMEAVEQGEEGEGKIKGHMGAVKQGEEGGVGGGVQNEALQEGREGGKQKVEVSGGEEKEERKICLHLDQYVHILRQVFPKSSSSNNKSSAMQAKNTIFGEDQIKQMIDVSKQEILWELQLKCNELQGGKDDKRQDQTGQNTECQNTEAILKVVEQKMEKITHEFKEQLKIKGLLDDIARQLKEDKCLFILKIDETVDLPRWEHTRNALSLLECIADVLIVTTAKDIQQAKEYCYPQSEPIEYSLVGFYHVTVLEITKQQKNEENYDPQIFRNILEQCEPHEVCMKIFTHALYVNPKRSNEELNKLHNNLQAPPKSFDIIAKKMLKFSYTDMPKEYKSCLLYLAIFPPRYKIRRSTLIGRWVAEGLISREDWPSSVKWANRCFDELINRWFADPAETGAAGKVKSCVVGDLVHGFITKIARKQHIVETRLSHHLARHFSIFNDLQLCSSDKIDDFFQRLSKTSRVSLLKVLDLEECQCFGGKNQHYLEDICSKMLLLKYLSLRGTKVTQLPSKINNLRELEVLDIRDTKVPMTATANILLLKLKRLLAGNTDRIPRLTLRAEESVSNAVQIPHKIEKMLNIEVLSNVSVQSGQYLKGIRKLWQLRKLGVVVDDNFSYLKNLFGAINDLHECLCSLSITVTTPTSEATASSGKLSQPLNHPPKLLESLSISGTTQKVDLLPLFIKDVDKNLLNKLTLSCTSLSQDNLDDLAKLPKLQSIRLRHIAFTNIESLVFKEDEFKYLKYLLVEGPSFTKMSFEDKAACMLEKMTLSFTNIESVSGVDGLQKFEEVELSMSSSSKKNDTLLSSFNDGKQTVAKLTIVGTSLEQGDQGTQNQNKITFNEGKFCKLKLLTMDCSATTEVVFTSGSAPMLEKIVSSWASATKVVFTNGSAPKLEKIVWSSSTSLSGIDSLPSLKELEFKGDLVPDVVKEAIENHKKNKPLNGIDGLVLKHNKPEIQDPAKRDNQDNDDDDDATRFPLLCCKPRL